MLKPNSSTHMIRAVKKLRIFILFYCSFSATCLTFSATGFAFPVSKNTVAHWHSRNEISFFETPSIPLPANPHFILVSEELPLQIELPVTSHSQDQWTLSAQEIFPRMEDLLRTSARIQVQNDQHDIILKAPLRFTGLLNSEMSDSSAQLGLRWKNGIPELRVWAPTAQKMSVLLYNSPDATQAEIFSLNRENKGFRSIQGRPEWKNKYYLYQMVGFSPYNGQKNTFTIVDPYAPNLSADREFGQLVDLNDPDLQPTGWNQLSKPPLARLQDSVVYELHLRDFTVNDPSLPASLKGTYLGMVDSRSTGFAHLKELAQAGLTHVHFMPLMEFGSIPEKNSSSSSLVKSESGVDSSSTAPQEEIGKNRRTDKYNWGYDPAFWFTPQGSYSSNANGPARILEMRKMIQALNANGLRIVMDVVFNHSYTAELETDSNLDVLVPYYYHRYDERGNLQKSTCCNDMATETVMMEKLISDSLIFWPKNYRIDGFRFDLLNMHPKEQVKRLKKNIQNLNPHRDGVDGSKILLYGEAWPFGSLEALYPGTSFSQNSSYDVGVGVFNDRLRDALRGGSTNNKQKSDQGFATGLFWDYNEEPANIETPTDINQQKDKLLFLGDVVKIGIAGNLRDFVIRDRYNNPVRGGSFYFRNIPVGYSANPIETITYASAHDGYSLFDAIQAKLPYWSSHRSPPAASEDDRARTQKLILGTILLSQGIPFFEGGSELLRSKSGDQDSYDSGDWFNDIDWSFDSNNWGVGLPPAWGNQPDWSFWKPRLDLASTQISRESILSTSEYFKALLRVRRSSRLFSLDNTFDINSRLTFPADEKSNGDIPGMVVFSLQNKDLQIDPHRKSLWIFVNAGTQTQLFQNSILKGLNLRLHPDLNTNIDPMLYFAKWSSDTGTVQIPGRTILVLEEPQ